MPLRAVLLDVGGTLWPDRFPPPADGIDPCLAAVCQVVPTLDPERALIKLRHQLAQDNAIEQRTHALLAQALRDLGHTATDDEVVAVRRALCAPAAPGRPLFPGAVELLATIRAGGLRCVIVSNVRVRGAREYWHDFAALDLADLIDAVVTSLDVGFRKPHPAIFQAALVEAQCSPSECLMIGNSEGKDIEPALGLGMRAIRVAIEEPPPRSSAAEAVATNLDTVAQLVAEACQST